MIELAILAAAASQALPTTTAAEFKANMSQYCEAKFLQDHNSKARQRCLATPVTIGTDSRAGNTKFCEAAARNHSTPGYDECMQGLMFQYWLAPD